MKAPKNRRVFVIGYGAATPLGKNLNESWQKAVQGKAGFRKVTRCEVDSTSFVVGEIPQWDPRALDFTTEKEVYNWNANFVILGVDSTTIKSNNVIAEPGLQKSSFTEEPVSIQVFYTANALDTLPHEILIDKIVFQILDDPTGKIPSSFLNTDLGIITTAQLNKISNENSKIKNMLATEFNLTESELATIPTSIKDTDVAATTMIDDHAISLSRLAP